MSSLCCKHQLNVVKTLASSYLHFFTAVALYHHLKILFSFNFLSDEPISLYDDSVLQKATMTKAIFSWTHQGTFPFSVALLTDSVYILLVYPSQLQLS